MALACSRPAAPVLIVTHGCSGSGKTLLTQSLLELIGAIRVRADVERKRLFGLPPLARSDAALKDTLYSSTATEVTHARLREAATLALAQRPQRDPRRDVPGLRATRAGARAGRTLGVRFVVVDFQAPADTLRQRVQQRAQRADDASEAELAVLEDQLAHAQPLRPQELPEVFAFDAEPRYDEASMAARWGPLLQRLGWPVDPTMIDHT